MRNIFSIFVSEFFYSSVSTILCKFCHVLTFMSVYVSSKHVFEKENEHACPRVFWKMRHVATSSGPSSASNAKPQLIIWFPSRTSPKDTKRRGTGNYQIRDAFAILGNDWSSVSRARARGRACVTECIRRGSGGAKKNLHANFPSERAGAAGSEGDREVHVILPEFRLKRHSLVARAKLTGGFRRLDLTRATTRASYYYNCSWHGIVTWRGQAQ